jgi:hypothetical protein
MIWAGPESPAFCGLRVSDVQLKQHDVGPILVARCLGLWQLFGRHARRDVLLHRRERDALDGKLIGTGERHIDIIGVDIESARVEVREAEVPDGSATARAIDYSLNRWAALTRYIDDGELAELPALTRLLFIALWTPH